MEQQRAQLILDHRALLLDDDHLVETLAEGARALRLDRPGQPDLVNADAKLSPAALVDAKLVQRLAHVRIGLA